jgi:hypothetical protein
MPRSSMKGKTKSQAEIESALRDAKAVDLRVQGKTLQEIAGTLGWGHRQTAADAITRALRRNEWPQVEALRALESEKLDRNERRCLELLDKLYFVVSLRTGKLVRDEHDQALTDPAPTLAILRELRMIGERRAKLFGLDAPMRVIVEEVTEEIVKAEMDRINALADALERELGLEES